MLTEGGVGAGTLFSIENVNAGGGFLRFDWGPLHSGAGMGWHSIFRPVVNGVKFGSTKQYPVFAPFKFWKYPVN